MTEEQIKQEVEELLEAVKVHGLPPLSDKKDLPKFAFPVCSRVSRTLGIGETIFAGYYCRKESDYS